MKAQRAFCWVLTTVSDMGTSSRKGSALHRDERHFCVLAYIAAADSFFIASYCIIVLLLHDHMVYVDAPCNIALAGLYVTLL